MREQVPWGLRRLDDPWGVTWRVVNRLKRISPRRAWRFHSGRFREIAYDRPIFIIGAPRSGTTALFRLLSAHPELGSLGREGHDLWRRYHHPRRSGWRSDAVGPGEVQAGERSFVLRYLHAHFAGRRFVEKTPENCLRIPYLLELFPDAHFVFVKRDPRATLSSMINGWRHPLGRFRSYFVPERLEIPGYSRPHQWNFVLVDGWRDLRTATIPRIIAEQWRQCVRAALEGRRLVPPERWHELWLEDLLGDPLPAVRRLLGQLDLSEDEAVLRRAAELPVTAINRMSGPGAGDWRENEAEVVALLPTLSQELRDYGRPPGDAGSERGCPDGDAVTEHGGRQQGNAHGPPPIPAVE